MGEAKEITYQYKISNERPKFIYANNYDNYPHRGKMVYFLQKHRTDMTPSRL